MIMVCIPFYNYDFIRDDDGETEYKSPGCIKKCLKFCLSHITLLGMVMVYCIAGGLMFEHLEKTNEKQECLNAMNNYYPIENDTVYRLILIANNYKSIESINDAKEVTACFIVGSFGNQWCILVI